MTALADSPTAALKALHPGLLAATTALGGTAVACEGQDGTSQTFTRSKKDVLRAMRVFVQDTNAVTLVPAYRQHPDKLKEVLPQGLMHLTDAHTTDFPVRFEAFAETLTAHAAALTPAPGKAAAKLLEELTAATTAKDAGLRQPGRAVGAGLSTAVAGALHVARRALGGAPAGRNLFQLRVAAPAHWRQSQARRQHCQALTPKNHCRMQW